MRILHHLHTCGVPCPEALVWEDFLLENGRQMPIPRTSRDTVDPWDRWGWGEGDGWGGQMEQDSANTDGDLAGEENEVDNSGNGYGEPGWMVDRGLADPIENNQSENNGIIAL